jgi:hypothetical protein
MKVTENGNEDGGNGNDNCNDWPGCEQRQGIPEAS